MSRPQARVADGARTAVDTAGLGVIVRHVAQGTAVTRADLARETGLSRSTISQRVDTLINAGLVVEGNPAPSRGGRPGTQLSLNANAGLILSADLGATQARLAVSDLAGHELRSLLTDIAINQEPTQVLDEANQHLNNLLTNIPRTPHEVRAVVIGLPAPVEFAKKRAIKPPLMPAAWDGYPVADYFASRYPAPILVDNDVNLMALGEHRENYPHLDHLLFVKVGTGIGCGIIASRQLYRGEAGAAGDIGHIRVPGNDTQCRCGNIGCLEAVAGGQAVADRLKQKYGKDTNNARDVAKLVKVGDIDARSEVRTTAKHIGEVLAAVVSFANPSAIIIGGSLASLDDDAFLAGIRSAIHDRALPLATRKLLIEASILKEKAGTIGAITLAQQEIMSETNITALLRAYPRP